MKKILLFTLVLSIFLSAGDFASAQNTLPGDTNASAPPTDTRASAPSQKIVPLQNPVNATDVKGILFLAVDLAIFIGTIIAVIMFIWIGFKFVLARGNEIAIKEARQWFLYAVIGTAVLISSKVIVEVVKQTLISAGVVNESQFK